MRGVHPGMISTICVLVLVVVLIVFVDDVRESSVDPLIVGMTLAALIGCLMAIIFTGTWSSMDTLTAGLLWVFVGLVCLFVYLMIDYSVEREPRHIWLTIARSALFVGSLWSFYGLVQRSRRRGAPV